MGKLRRRTSSRLTKSRVSLTYCAYYARRCALHRLSQESLELMGEFMGCYKPETVKIYLAERSPYFPNRSRESKDHYRIFLSAWDHGLCHQQLMPSILKAENHPSFYLFSLTLSLSFSFFGFISGFILLSFFVVLNYLSAERIVAHVRFLTCVFMQL